VPSRLSCLTCCCCCCCRCRSTPLARCVLLACAVLLAMSVGGCRPKSTERARVAVSIFPVYDLVRRVAGPDADVVLVLPPGKSPHAFEPGAAESEAASRVKLGVMVGLGLLKVGDRVPTLTVAAPPAGDGEARARAREGDDAPIDPHVWLDPQRARLIVKAVAEELSRLDARHAGAYRQRTSEVDASLGALDRELEAATAPWKERGVVTFHASFGYLAERYRLGVAGVVEADPGTPPSPKVTVELTALVAAKKAAIFREPQLDGAPAEAIARGAGAAVGVLDPLGGTAETDSYEKLLRFDTASLARALH
jgi:zinc transport system substrate-binding protein